MTNTVFTPTPAHMAAIRKGLVAEVGEPAVQAYEQAAGDDHPPKISAIAYTDGAGFGEIFCYPHKEAFYYNRILKCLGLTAMYCADASMSTHSKTWGHFFDDTAWCWAQGVDEDGDGIMNLNWFDRNSRMIGQLVGIGDGIALFEGWATGAWYKTP